MHKKQCEKIDRRKALRVLFVSPSLRMGGLERVLVTMANALANSGHEITIITWSEGEELKDELDKNVSFKYVQPKPFPLLRKIKGIRNYYDDGKWETRASAKKLYRYYVGNNDYDVEIGFFRGMSIKIVSGSTNKNARHVAWVHSDFMNCKGITNNFKNFEDCRNAYLKYDDIVCVSQQAAKSFKEKLSIDSNVKVIYNLCSIEKIKQQSKELMEDSFDFGFNVILVGRLVDEIKGIKRTARVFKRLYDEGIDVGLYIVGDGVDKENIEKYISNNKISNVKLLGFQKNPYKYINAADLLICSSYYEGYNLTVAEALLLNVPVLSTKCTGPAEILDNGQYGMLVENSEKGLYDGLKKIVTDKKSYKHYKEMTAQRVTFFSTEAILKEIEELFN